MRRRTVHLLIAATVVAPTAALAQSTQPATQPINVCVVRRDSLQVVEARWDQATGDTLIKTDSVVVKFATMYPLDSSYAANAKWYSANTPLRLFNGRYVKYGLPRVLGVTDVSKVAKYKGIPVFADTVDDDAKKPTIIYIPVSTGCAFQPYERK